MGSHGPMMPRFLDSSEWLCVSVCEELRVSTGLLVLQHAAAVIMSDARPRYRCTQISSHAHNRS